MVEPVSTSIAATVIALCVPVTAMILRYNPKDKNGNSKYVTEVSCGDRMGPVQEDIHEIRKDIRTIMNKIIGASSGTDT